LFVFGTLRVSLNMDYDRLQNLANNHRSLRLVVGHGELGE
jgi:IS5 family transposase